MSSSLSKLFSHLSEGTSKPRIRFLNTLKVSPSQYNQLRDTDKIMKDFIYTSENPTTRSTRMWHIITFLEAIGQADLAGVYRALLSPIADASRAKQSDTTTTVRADRYEDSLQSLRDKLKASVPPFERSTDYNRTVDQIKALQNYVILCMYCIEPPCRNDLWELKVGKKAADVTNSGNHIIMTPKTAYVVLNRYKNAKLLGQQKRPLSAFTARQVRNLLLLYKDILGSSPEYLFNQFENDELVPTSSDTMSKRVSLLSKHMFNKPISINDWRHLYEIDLQASEKYKNMSYDEKKEAHGKLMHSVDTGLKYNRVKGSSE